MPLAVTSCCSPSMHDRSSRCILNGLADENKRCTSAGHLHPPFLAIMDEIQDGLRYIFQTKSKYVCLISGTGHAGSLKLWLQADLCSNLTQHSAAMRRGLS